MKIYNVYCDLDPQALTQVALEVVKKWVAFALGHEELNGHLIEGATGWMASHIHVEGQGSNHIAIIMDETKEHPEAGILEEGHRGFDMKPFLKPGTYYPMHRGPGTFTGMAKTPSNNARKAAIFKGDTNIANSWLIPEMPAWSPAAYLAEMIRNGEFTK